MGLFSRLFNRGQPYVDAGMALTIQLCREFNLPDWHNGLPDYTEAELERMDRGLRQFQAIADKELGGKAVFHPEAAPQIQRSVAGEALFDYARDLAMEITGGSEHPRDWRLAVSAFLKAWASKLDPMAMIYLGDFLSRIDKPEAAKAAYRVVLHLPSYAKTLWGPGHDELAQRNVAHAKEALAAQE